MNDAEREGTLADLGNLLEGLESKWRVYTRHGRLPYDMAPPAPGALAAEVSALVTKLHTYWQRYASDEKTPSVPEIEASLQPLDAAAAIVTMTRLAAQDLVWPGHQHMDRDQAHRAALRIVDLLGPDATWWTNQEDDSSWTAVTACTFDGVIAGSNGEQFMVLIQVGED
ncbi:hypothetical protein P8605_11460 [Streptomyces sp. T-3]|nr:hypothetical protein [Streptomyces sp. T-3]